MFKFGDPWWLNMIWGAAGLFIFGWVWEASRRNALKKFFGKKTDFLISSLSTKKRWWHLLLQCLALASFAAALARPLLGSQLQEVKQTGVEMIIAVDVSNSMLAEDDKPSRLEHAKHEINHLLDELTGDRIGLVAFAGSAMLVSPMTSDHSAIKLFVSSLSVDSVSTQGTNFKDVVEEAIRAFDRGGVEALNGVKPTRVLVVASDGEDNEPGGLAEAKRAVDQGIRIFTLGFGSPKGAPIPMRDDHGGLIGYKKDKAGQVVMSVPSDEGLAKLAEAGQGTFYHSSFTESEIKNLVQDIDKLQKSDFKSRLATDFDEKFQIPLLIGLMFAFLDLLFGERRKANVKWRGRFEVSK
jgi:Ca-activated chloride channel homolog